MGVHKIKLHKNTPLIVCQQKGLCKQGVIYMIQYKLQLWSLSVTTANKAVRPCSNWLHPRLVNCQNICLSSTIRSPPWPQNIFRAMARFAKTTIEELGWLCLVICQWLWETCFSFDFGACITLSSQPHKCVISLWIDRTLKVRIKETSHYQQLYKVSAQIISSIYANATTDISLWILVFSDTKTLQKRKEK